MAPDNWHHLEGTYPRAGVFRLFLYDDFTRPMALRGVAARAFTRDRVDPATQRDEELTAAALTVSRTGQYLEARVPLTLPAQITVKVRFAPGGPEHRFDFQFPEYTKEPLTGAAHPATASTASPVGAAAPDMAAETTAALMTTLRASNDQVQTLLDHGALAQLYLPALAAKDAALVLDARADALPAEPARIRSFGRQAHRHRGMADRSRRRSRRPATARRRVQNVFRGHHRVDDRL